LAAHIDRFIFREDAAPRDVTAHRSARLVDGTQALGCLATAARVAESSFAPLGLAHLTIGNLMVNVLRLPITGLESRLCFAPIEQAAALEQALSAALFTDSSSEEFEARRIANFWPVAGHEISERTLPQELDRDARAISFTKGCYLGQETVARLDALGEVQKKLCLVRLNSERDVATELPLVRDGKEVGKLTSVAPLASEQARLALAAMRRGSFAVGSEFYLGDVPGLVIAHP
jgi:folate-binding protein YgfZ